MKAIFSRQFRDGLLREEARYCEISERLASAFHERVAGQTREIIRWSGGDHVGPHGFPCRRTKPFPFFIYYQKFTATRFTSSAWFTNADTLNFLRSWLLPIASGRRKADPRFGLSRV